MSLVDSMIASLSDEALCLVDHWALMGLRGHGLRQMVVNTVVWWLCVQPARMMMEENESPIRGLVCKDE